MVFTVFLHGIYPEMTLSNQEFPNKSPDFATTVLHGGLVQSFQERDKINHPQSTVPFRRGCSKIAGSLRYVPGHRRPRLRPSLAPCDRADFASNAVQGELIQRLANIDQI